MNRRNVSFLLLLSGVLLLTACNNNIRQKTAYRLAAFTAAAGPEVSSFSYPHPMYSWQPLGEQALVVYVNPQRAYLLNVSLCPDLPYASGIKLSSTVGQVMRRLDKIWVSDSKFPCPIERIRPIDLKKLKNQSPAMPPKADSGAGQTSG